MAVSIHSECLAFFRHFSAPCLKRNHFLFLENDARIVHGFFVYVKSFLNDWNIAKWLVWSLCFFTLSGFCLRQDKWDFPPVDDQKLTESRIWLGFLITNEAPNFPHTAAEPLCRPPFQPLINTNKTDACVNAHTCTYAHWWCSSHRLSFTWQCHYPTVVSRWSGQQCDWQQVYLKTKKTLGEWSTFSAFSFPLA